MIRNDSTEPLRLIHRGIGFGVGSQPAWVFQDAEGNRDRVSGALPPTDVEARLAAIAEPA